MSKKFSEAGFPAPNQYDDWRSWAASFLVALDSLSSEEVHNFPLYKRDPGKTREGLPAGVDGDMIRVLDEDEQRRLYVFENGSWERAQEDVQTAVSDKMDINLSNLSQQGINNILNLVAIDYTRIVAIESPYTAPTWGWVGWNNTGGGNAIVNGVTVWIGGNDSYNEGPAVLFVSPGDVVELSRDADTSYFAPCKGAPNGDS